MQNENNVCSQFTLISKNQPINFQPITFVLTWVSKIFQLFFSIPMVMTFPSVCAINGSSKLKKKALPVRHFGLGFGSGFSGIREFSGFWIGFGYRKNFVFRFPVSKLPVRVWVLGSVCLLSRSHFKFFISQFQLQLLRLF